MMPPPAPLPLALVVLAAGASSRLGTPKALVRLRSSTDSSALELLLAAGASLGDERPLVVTGGDRGAIAAHLARSRHTPELCENGAWRAGRSGSVRLACELRIGRDLCLTPVDVPLVPASVFRALAREWVQRGRPESGWLGPFVRREGTRLFGHPIVVGRELARRLKDFPPDQPLSQLRAEARPLLALEVVEPEILDDLDTPGDLARLEARER